LRLFDGPVQFVPVQASPPTFQLALRHVVPQEQIPEGIDANTIEHFPIKYDEEELGEAVGMMEKMKRLLNEANEEVSNVSEPGAKKMRGSK
jgi:hypothetical protein